MRKYLILSVILSLALVLPVFYPRWREGRRLRQIDEIKKEVIKQEGMKQKDVLKLFENRETLLLDTFHGKHQRVSGNVWVL
ncbi:TPA: hypothetical protein ENG04_04525 [Candidatus Poribacteria bacterium]|nr:hypothetical protein [Candidatus Poribacteria bacterium]HEX29326.1 hypothetical protein [Candidatus Poribacteria bacterium]